MWVIFFQGTPHFWLIGGETYRVGKKDCHVVIQDDRSISRMHLTIRVGLTGEQGERSSTSSTPQPITLTDLSTYGTSIAAAGEEVEDRETHDSNITAHGTTTTAALDTGIVGLRYTPSAIARGRSGSTSNQRSGSDKKMDAQPALKLPKGVPYDVSVHRTPWRDFTVQLGHHGAALRLAWVDVSVLCEDVDVEMQTKLEHALRYCGVRQAVVVSALQPPPRSSSSKNNAESSSVVQPQPQQQHWSQSTLEERSAQDAESTSIGAKSLPVVLGGSGALSLSQRTSLPATPSVSGPSFSRPSHPTQALTPAKTTTTTRESYDNVDFLVTSTVQPSTAVVGMLCLAVPIVSPAFFIAMRDRVSPQVPLPDPRRFIPPLSTWWCDLIAHARQAVGEEWAKKQAAAVKSGQGTEDTSATASPVSSSVTTVNQAVTTTSAARTVTSAIQLSEYFAPHPQRRELFHGVVFVVVQRVLYEEVMRYLDCTGAVVVWEGGLGDWVTEISHTAARLSFSTKGFHELQSFFLRHQRHLLLYNETEEMPFAHCLRVLQQALGLCSVEYGALIESIVLVRRPHSILQANFPDNARLPQTIEEVQASVRLALGETSSEDDTATQDGGSREATQDNDGDDDNEEFCRGRRTIAHPLFSDFVVGSRDGTLALRRKGRCGDDGLANSESHLHKRSRREDADGWVTLGKSTAVPVPHKSLAVCAKTVNGREEKAAAAVRTVDIHCSPFSLPPYPCFAQTEATTKTKTTATTTNLTEPRKAFVKQTLPPAEPLVELEEQRARRQLAASMLVARVPTVDADSVVPDQVVMGSINGDNNGGGGRNNGLQSRAAALANAAFNTFDTVAHHAAGKRRGTAARRGRGGGGVGGGRPHRSARETTAAAISSSEACPSSTTLVRSTAVVDVDDVEGVEEVGPRESTASSTFHIFDIDGIF